MPFKLHLKAFLIFTLLGTLVLPIQSWADGGQNNECEDAQVTSFTDGDEDEMEYTSPDDQVISGVCIKSGTNMFSDGHSESLEDGDYEAGCYTIEGVGTNTVTVERNFDDETCQGISHLDIYTQDDNEDGEIDEDENETEEDEVDQEVAATPTPTPEPTPTPTPTPGPTPTPSSSPDTGGQVQGTSTSDPAPTTGQVLGVSTLAATGTLTQDFLSAFFALLGTTMIGIGLYGRQKTSSP